MAGTVLIVDNNVELTATLAKLLRAEGFAAEQAPSASRARALMDELDPDVVLLDLHLPDGDGEALLDELRLSYPAARFIMITAHGSIRSAVAATRRGAVDYLTKPFEPAELLVSVRNAMRERTLTEELSRHRHSIVPGAVSPPDPTVPYPSEAIRQVAFLAGKAAGQTGLCLLLGESGTGKDFWARWIHCASARKDGPFFGINCAALSPQLAESELFGHEPGAFTGTRGRKRGLLELAEHGTLLLNEIGDLEPAIQAKLLSFLDHRCFVRVGGERSIAVNSRIIAATNRDLQRAVAEGSFRQDLFYRINVFTIEIPPLRQRLIDIPLLVEELLERLRAELGLPVRPTISPSAVDALMDYHWPGNIRELRNIIERAVILAPNYQVERISLGATPPSHRQQKRADDPAINVSFPTAGQTLHDVTQAVARQLVTEALRRSRTKQQAAALLGITRHALAHQLKALDIKA